MAKKHIKENPTEEIPTSGGVFSVIPTWKVSIVLAILSILLYANSLRNGFAVDDPHVITKNTLVNKGFASISELIRTPHFYGYMKPENDTYRPLSLVSFAIEYGLWGEDPFYFHLLNILFYAGCVVLLFTFLKRLFDKTYPGLAFIASLLFALHPIHTEVVANIKSRDELYCFFFAFIGLHVFLSYTRSGKLWLLFAGGLSVFLSLLSKETSATFLAVVPVIFFFYGSDDRKRSLLATGSVIVAFVAFMLLRKMVLALYHADQGGIIDFIDNQLAKPGLSYVTRLATAVLALGYYLKLVIVPYPLSWDYAYNTIPFVSFGDVRVLAVLAVYLFLLVFSIKRLLTKSKDPLALGILFFLITLFIVSNIPFLIGSVVGERLLFFPSVGFCIVVAFLLTRWAGKSALMEMMKDKKVLSVLFPVFFIYATITVGRNPDWVDDATIYFTDVVKHPENARMNEYVGAELINNIAPNEKDPVKFRQLMDSAIGYFRTALAIYPDYEVAEWNIGHSFGVLGQFDSAEVHNLRANKLMPKNTDIVYNLARLYYAWKKYPQAIYWNKRMLELMPQNNITNGNMSFAYMDAGIYDTAIYYARKTLANDGGQFVVGYEIMARAYKALGNNDSAMKYLFIAQRNNPNFRF